MHRGIHQFVVVLVLLLAAAFVLQLDGAAALQAASAAAPAQAVVPTVVVPQTEQGGREYFVSRRVREVVPTGAPTITMPILLYHYVRTPPSMLTDLVGYKLSVSPEDFAAQMNRLAVNRNHPVYSTDAPPVFSRHAP